MADDIFENEYIVVTRFTAQNGKKGFQVTAKKKMFYQHAEKDYIQMVFD